MTHRIVLVSGPPGAGKSTLAAPLAERLGFALLAKDHIKEVLHDSLDAAPDLASSQRLGAAAMRLLWSLAGRCPDAVLEANFLPGHTAPEVARLGATVVELYCQCPPEEAARRFAARAAAPGHHPVHVDREISAEALAKYERPLGVGTLITVDTSRPVDLAGVAGRIRAEFRVPSAAGTCDERPPLWW